MGRLDFLPIDEYQQWQEDERKRREEQEAQRQQPTPWQQAFSPAPPPAMPPWQPAPAPLEMPQYEPAPPPMPETPSYEPQPDWSPPESRWQPPEQYTSFEPPMPPPPEPDVTPPEPSPWGNIAQGLGNLNAGIREWAPWVAAGGVAAPLLRNVAEEQAPKAMDWFRENATEPTSEFAFGPTQRKEIPPLPLYQSVIPNVLKGAANIQKEAAQGADFGDVWSQAAERWRGSPETFPGQKGALEMLSPADTLLNAVPLPGARAAKAVGRLGQEVAEQAPRVARRVGEALPEIGRALADETGAVRLPGGETPKPRRGAKAAEPTPTPEPPVAASGAVEKQPWEMTADDYVSANMGRILKTKGFSGKQQTWRQQADEYLRQEHFDAVDDALRTGKPVPTEAKPIWARTQAEDVAYQVQRMKEVGNPEAETPGMIKTIKDGHRQEVEDTLKYTDEPVPPEVLADYPDLAAKYKGAVEPPKPVEALPEATPAVAPEGAVEVPSEATPSPAVPELVPPDPNLPTPPKTVPPKTTPPPPPPKTVPPPPPPKTTPPSPRGNWLPEVHDTQAIIDRAYQPDVYRKITDKLDNPVTRAVGQAVGVPTRDIYKQGMVLRETIINDWRSAVVGAMARLREQGESAKLFNVDDAGRATVGNARVAIGDVLENPNKFSLTPEQKQYAETIHKLYDDQLERLTQNGVDVNQLPFPPGAHYVGRRAMGKIGSDGTLEVADISRGGSSRVGARAGFEKSRVFETEEEALKEGYRYFSPEETLNLNLNAAGRKIADQRLVDWILPQIPYRTAESPEALRVAKDYAQAKLRAAGQLSAVINRAYRGERVPFQSVASIGKFFPNEAAGLMAAAVTKPEDPMLRAGLQAVEKAIPNLRLQAQGEYYKARAVLAEASAQARQTHLGEGTVQAPAFAGKFFEAKTAEQLNKVLDLERPSPLRGTAEAISWVNALPRLMMTTVDIGGPMIQGQIAMFSRLDVWYKATRQMVRDFRSPKGAQEFLATHADTIRDVSQYGMIFQPSEFSAAMQEGGLLTKIPVMREAAAPFVRGYEGFLNAMRIYGWKATEHKATTDAEKYALAHFWNEMSGQVETGSMGISKTQQAVETALLFAPRYRRAVFSLIGDIARGDLRGEMARKTLGTATAAGLMGYIGTSYLFGQEPKLDPRQSDFMTVKVGDLNVGIGGAYVGTSRLLAQIGLDPGNAHTYAGRYIENLLSPAVGQIDRAIHYNYRYNAPWKAVKEIGSNFLPISAQTMFLDGLNLQEAMMGGAVEFLGGKSFPVKKEAVPNAPRYPGRSGPAGPPRLTSPSQYRYPGR